MKTLTPICSSIATFALFFSVASAKDPENMLDGFEKTGVTKNCLIKSRVRDTDMIDDYTIIFEAKGGKYYVNELNARCNRLAAEGRFRTQSTQNKFCSGDIITVFNDFNIVLGSCALGDFEELEEIQS